MQKNETAQRSCAEPVLARVNVFRAAGPQLKIYGNSVAATGPAIGRCVVLCSTPGCHIQRKRV
jgi:hypothetical protein